MSRLNSHDLFERAKKVSPGGVHSPVRSFRAVGGDPIFFKAAQGAYLTSVEGQRYIDFCQSFGPNILGHRDPDVERVVREAIGEAWTFGACEPYSLELAEWITKRLPFVESIRFVCSGTEAVMSALRVARAFTKRDLILKFDGCYHGHADSLLVCAGVSPQIASMTLVCALDNEEEFDKVIANFGDRLAAVIVEPLPANYGLLPQRKEWLKHIVAGAHKVGALMIFDEVISGFRVGLGGMAQELGIKPDLVTYGKIIGGGFPVGAYAGRRDLMNLVAPVGPVYQAGTLAANPIGMRAGLATLKKVEEKNVYEELENRTRNLIAELTDGFASADLPIRVVQKSSIFWLSSSAPTLAPASVVGSVTASVLTSAPDWYSRFFNECLQRGVYLPPSPLEVCFVSFAHTPEILHEAAEAMIAAARAVSKNPNAGHAK